MLRIFRHYIPHHFLILLGAEIMVLMASIYVGVAIRFWGADDAMMASALPLLPKVIVFTLVMVVAMTATGLYKNTFREGLEGMLLRLGLSMLLGLVSMIVVFYIFPTLFLGRGAFAIAFLFAVVCIIFGRVLFFRFAGTDLLARRVLVLGAGKGADQFSQLRRKVDQLGFQVVGYVKMPGDSDVVSEDLIVTLEEPLLEYVEENDIHEIVVALEDRRKSLLVDDLLDCKMSGIDVVDVLTFFERQTGKIRLDLLKPSWLIFSDGFRHGFLRPFLKRSFDVMASLFILSLAWPFIVGAAFGIWLESGFKGPIFYRQVRVGQNWRLFQVLKFRSMRVDAEKDGVARWAQKNDSRITRVGKFLRRTRIDELPQILNVLKGDMSFVGPRPERPEFVEQLAETIPYYAERHRVKPGITGWAQVRYPYGASEQDALEKLQYDLYYVKNYSLFLDLLILFQTAEVVLWGEGVH